MNSTRLRFRLGFRKCPLTWIRTGQRIQTHTHLSDPKCALPLTTLPHLYKKPLNVKKENKLNVDMVLHLKVGF